MRNMHVSLLNAPDVLIYGSVIDKQVTAGQRRLA